MTCPRSRKSCWKSSRTDRPAPQRSQCRSTLAAAGPPTFLFFDSTHHVPHPATDRAADQPALRHSRRRRLPRTPGRCPAAHGLCLRAHRQRPRQLSRAQPLGPALRDWRRPARAGLCRPYRRGAYRPAGAVEQPALRAHAPRRQAVRPRRQRHEDLHRRLRRGTGGIPGRDTGSLLRHCPAADQRRGRPFGGRHQGRGRAAARARRAPGLVHRGRAHFGGAHGRHDQERPPGHHERAPHGQGHPGPHRLPAAGAQPHPPGPAGPG